MVFQKRIRVISDGRNRMAWRKVTHTVQMVRTEAIASLRYQESGGMTGMIQIITADIMPRAQVAGWEGVFMSNEGAPRYLSDFGGTSEDYDNHQWSAAINS